MIFVVVSVLALYFTWRTPIIAPRSAPTEIVTTGGSSADEPITGQRPFFEPTASLSSNDMLPRGQKSVKEYSEDAKLLYNTWSDMYLLSSSSPPDSIIPPKGWLRRREFPLAPHLEDCDFLTENRLDSETRGSNGKSLDWLGPNNPLHDADPPWVRGANTDNLAMTRYMQAYLWNHQNPSNCRDSNKKFVLVHWSPKASQGMGSSFHVMAQVFAHALETDRVLVPMKKTFERSNYDGCEGDDRGSLDCFFFPIVSKECENIAMELFEKQNGEGQFLELDPKERLKTKTTVVRMEGQIDWSRHDYWLPNDTGHLVDDPITVEHLGKVLDFSSTKEKDESELSHTVSPAILAARWLQAQIVRYMLRWPSKNLCHATNLVRHEAFGMEVAEEVVESEDDMEFAEKICQTGDDPDESQLLGAIDLDKRPLEKSLWRKSSPFLPRPIVSIHVRLFERVEGVKLVSFASYMWLAERLRRHVPNLERVWLTTDAQPVVEESKSFTNWQFHLVDIPRVKNGQNSEEGELLEESLGLRALKHLANLQVATDCDYYIGALESNWSRNLNELRMTSGRLNAGFLFSP